MCLRLGRPETNLPKLGVTVFCLLLYIGKDANTVSVGQVAVAEVKSANALVVVHALEKRLEVVSCVQVTSLNS
jgi:hypothetical protein